MAENNLLHSITCQVVSTKMKDAPLGVVKYFTPVLGIVLKKVRSYTEGVEKIKMSM